MHCVRARGFASTVDLHADLAAGADPVTPSSAIVYEIFLATSSGAEDYAQPTWTTSPGATSFTTPGLTRNGPLYFLVRSLRAGLAATRPRGHHGGSRPAVAP